MEIKTLHINAGWDTFVSGGNQSEDKINVEATQAKYTEQLVQKIANFFNLDKDHVSEKIDIDWESGCISDHVN